MTENLGTQFGKASTEYARFRPSYPAELYDVILSQGPTERRAALDLGAGTGISTRYLSQCFEQVCAVEPDAAMLAAGSFAPNVTLQNASSEQVEFCEAGFQLITCGNAFYWMDGEALLPRLRRWLEPGGVLAVYRYDFPQVRHQQANRVVQQELAQRWDTVRAPQLRDTDYSRRIIVGCGLFGQVEVRLIENLARLSARQGAGFFASTSYGSAYAAGLPDQEAYWNDFAQRLEEAAGGQPMEVDFGLELILAR